ncbi:acyl-CoA dehydrogenase family protein [Bradyrhizobium uaiense]|uniref:Acyl-CoA dehydrogenase n=1 Tax=Bradyrhizobium uaiense TaxID=2594946 RepID=A0A6P1BT71_9BRAD|nr:acyl-CoA dehydrogenase family protein [Bradyrhizobium uaiense]NEV01384.1 acyl-CoA dehydrogenase [Bradyrhizobium uaiense]
MDFELTDTQRRWRDEIRAFLRESVTPELERERDLEGKLRFGPEARAFRRKVGQKGWWGLTWPKEYGGLAKGAIELHIMASEFDYAKVVPADTTYLSIAPMIMQYGTEENKEDFIPGITHGEFVVAVGYSEPDAGTDLASLRTRAELDGDEWVINGSKIWTSNAHGASHLWLCVRTDPNAPKHQGISVIMVPISTKGIDVQPLICWSDYRTNQVFFTDVRVPRRNLIGEVNKGWGYITGALTLERSAVSTGGDLRREVDDLIEVCRADLVGGVRLIERPSVQQRLAELDADVEVALLYGLRAASLIDNGEIPTATLTSQKIYTSELRQKIADYGMQIFGICGQLSWRDPGAPGHGDSERLYRYAPEIRFAGGTNEVLRDIIAQRGYGMPSYGRSRRS